ncbi:uncharacterized protein LOC143034161 [Oratosquilla oratoria]|uniref:uncharacterized protein LOC143034161 n=1 Tax=Oratosquilla oratoria TaxID=337810 RepID=UPI003F769683
MILINGLITYVVVISLCSSLFNEKFPSQIMGDFRTPIASANYTTIVTYSPGRHKEAKMHVKNRDDVFPSAVSPTTADITSQVVATSESIIPKYEILITPESPAMESTKFINGKKKIKYELTKFLTLHRQHYLKLLNAVRKVTLVSPNFVDSDDNNTDDKSLLSIIQNRLGKMKNVKDENKTTRIKMKVNALPELHFLNLTDENYIDVSQIGLTENLDSEIRTIPEKAFDYRQKISVPGKTNSGLRYELYSERERKTNDMDLHYGYIGLRLNEKNIRQRRKPRGIRKEIKKLTEISHFLYNLTSTTPSTDNAYNSIITETNPGILSSENIHSQVGLQMDILRKYVNSIEGKTSNKSILRRRRRRDRHGNPRKEGLMYLPIGGTTKVQCPTAADAAGISITQMAFLSMCLTVFNIIANVNNNINNNNNNNNLNSDNNVANNNAQLSLNVNNAAQINVMLPPPVPGKRKRRSMKTGRLKKTGTSMKRRHLKKMEKNAKRGNLKRKRRNKKREVLMMTERRFSKKANKKKEQKSEDRRPQDEIEMTKNADYTRILPNSYVWVTQYSRMIADSSVGNNIKQLSFSVRDSLRFPIDKFIMEPSTRTKLINSQPLHFHQQRGNLSARRPLGGRQPVKVNSTVNASAEAVLIVKTAQRILHGTPYLSTECMGLQTCQHLAESEENKWIYALSSFFLYCRTYGCRKRSLKSFLKKALQKQCNFLFPKC